MMAAEEAAGGMRGRKKSIPEEQIEFRGVRRRASGKYGARIKDSSGQRWLGTFDTAEEAARAFDAAAVRRSGAAAETNFGQIPTSGADDAGVAVHRPSAPVKKKAKPDAGAEFCGVYRRSSGKYGADIRDSKGKGNAQSWLGTFDTVEDAAAVRLRGAAAGANFEQTPTSSADDAGGAVHLPSSPLQKKASPEDRIEFRGVYRKSSGKYGAQISAKNSKSEGKAQRWLGTFDTAEEAARAFDAAAVKLRGAAAKTNFSREPTFAADDEGVAVHQPSPRVKRKAAARQPEARTVFRGVYHRRSGKYEAQIRVRRSNSKGKTRMWLGAFGTAEEAARAYDAAAVRLDGASALTNFEQSRADDDGDATAEPCGKPAAIVRLQGAAAKTNFKQPPMAVAADYGEEWRMDLLIDFLELSALDFRTDSIIPGAQHSGLKADLTPAEWHQVDEFLKDIESTDDREALIEAAAILHQISVAGMEMVGEPNQHK